jgi:hypothetical protein
MQSGVLQSAAMLSGLHVRAMSTAAADTAAPATELAVRTVLDDSGFIALAANTINDVHVYFDVPWWVAIVGSTLGLRLFLATFNLRSVRGGWRLRKGVGAGKIGSREAACRWRRGRACAHCSRGCT